MIPIPQQPQSEHHSIPIMNSQQHQDGFNQPQSAHSERSEWLDVDEEFPPSKPKSASMLHSYSSHSQNSDQISSSEFSSQPFYNHPHQQQHQERMIESQHFHHPNPSSHRVPSVIRQFHPDQNENQDPTDGSERVGPEWNLNLVESSQQQQGPTFSYIDSGSKLGEQQPQLAPVRVSKACVPCRDRRIRCQGGHPHCTSCIEKNRTHLCVYRIIPPRVVTRKALEDLQSRLKRAEDQLHQSNDANRELKARLWEADKELEKLKSGEKVRELERHLRELKVKLLGYQSQLSSPNYRQVHGHHYSPSQESNVSFGTAEDVTASPYGSPSFQRHWSSDDQDSQEPFHPNKRPQLDSQAIRSPYARPVRTESVSSRHSNSQRTVDVGRVGQGQVGPNRRRAATTSTVGPSASLYTNQQPQGIGHGLNISFDREGDSDLRRGDAHQSFSSQNGHHQGVPRSQSVSSSSSAFSPGYPASPNSLPLPTPPVLELGSGYLTGRPLGSPFKADVQLEPCYLQTPFNDMNSIRHPTSTPLDMAGTRHKYQYIDPKVHYAQERDHHHHDPNQNQKQNQASNHHNHQHQPHQHTSHSHSQSLPSSQFTFKPQFVKHASPQFSPDTSVDSGVNLSEQHRN